MRGKYARRRGRVEEVCQCVLRGVEDTHTHANAFTDSSRPTLLSKLVRRTCGCTSLLLCHRTNALLSRSHHIFAGAHERCCECYTLGTEMNGVRERDKKHAEASFFFRVAAAVDTLSCTRTILLPSLSFPPPPPSILSYRSSYYLHFFFFCYSFALFICVASRTHDYQELQCTSTKIIITLDGVQY